MPGAETTSNGTPGDWMDTALKALGLAEQAFDIVEMPTSATIVRWARARYGKIRARSVQSEIEKYLHLDQRQGWCDFPFYKAALLLHPKLLAISVEEFQQLTQLPIPVSEFLLEQPEAIPRPDLLPAIARALLIREQHVRTGRRPYTKELAVSRIRLYQQKNLACQSTVIVDTGSAKKVLAGLAREEYLRMRQLGLVLSTPQRGAK